MPSPAATPAPRQRATSPTAEATTAGGGATADGGPTDIPLVNADNTVLLASAQLVSYQTTADIATTIKFYKDAMPTNGWTADANLTVETPTATVLAFTKDTRSAQVSITGDPTSSKTIVVITVVIAPAQSLSGKRHRAGPSISATARPMSFSERPLR